VNVADAVCNTLYVACTSALLCRHCKTPHLCPERVINSTATLCIGG
jgi:hypothetical protein